MVKSWSSSSKYIELPTKPYVIKEEKETYKTILINKEKTVARYLFRFRFKFLRAKSPSIPKIIRVSLDVFSFFPFNLMSVVNRIASIGVIFAALFAGI